MSPLSLDAIEHPRVIDANRLTLPLSLLDKAALILPACIGEVSDQGDYHDLTHAIEIIELALAELHRLMEKCQ